MKNFKRLIRSIYLFFYYLTPKGKEARYWVTADKNLNNHLFEKGMQELELEARKREVKTKCIQFAKMMIKKKKYSNFHVGKVTSEKFKDELEETNLKIHPNTLKFNNA